MRRKGELSNTALDRGWPHQIVLRASACVGAVDQRITTFCEGLSVAPRGHTYVSDDGYMRVVCFAVRKDAEAFQREFGGSFIDPNDRPRWPAKIRRRAN